MQELTSYLIIGSGRMAQHFAHYLQLLGIPFESWARQKNSQQQLKTISARASHILLLIKDDAIENFVVENSFLKEKTLIHFSGHLTTDGIHAAHPLYTFGETLYDLKNYEVIPFIISSDKSFAELLSGLKNPHYKIEKEQRPYYHALCVMAGNFTTLVWQKMFHEIESRLGIPKEAAHAYLDQISQNLKLNPEKALTGPLVRKDKKTIEANLNALKEDRFEPIYQAFVRVFYENH